jgi:hypothetical protein
MGPCDEKRGYGHCERYWVERAGRPLRGARFDGAGKVGMLLRKEDSGQKKSRRGLLEEGSWSSMLARGRVRRGSGHRQWCAAVWLIGVWCVAEWLFGVSMALMEDGDDLEWQADLEWLEGGHH